MVMNRFFMFALSLSLLFSGVIRGDAFFHIDEKLECPQKAKKSRPVDINKNKLINQALFLSAGGYEWIAPNLDETEKTIYDNDSTFINDFPFEDYRPVVVSKQGIFFINDINDIIKNCLRRRAPWEIKNKLIIEKYVRENSIALDIGSHIGTHTVTMAQSVGNNGTVLAFEPGKTIYRELCYNLVINHCENVYPIRCAIGKSKSTIEVVSSHPNNEGGSYVVDSTGGSNSAILLPLDVLELNNVSFIKIDVENMEADVLDGAEQTIRRNRPVMLIEI